LQVTGNDIALSVQDNGTGFGLTAGLRTPDGPHSGLNHIRERIEEFGGVLTVISTPTGGTQLVATVPRTSFHPHGND
jgi:signal transduction histidine kinase